MAKEQRNKEITTNVGVYLYYGLSPLFYFLLLYHVIAAAEFEPYKIADWVENLILCRHVTSLTFRSKEIMMEIAAQIVE